MSDAAPYKKPRILFLTHVGQPGGAEFVMMRLCDSVKDHCEVIHFLPGVIEGILEKRSISSSILKMPEGLSGLKRSGGWTSLIKTIPGVLGMIKGLVVRERDFDLIVAMSQKAFILSALAKLFARKPLIWFMNDLISKSHFSKALIFIMTKLFARFADAIVVNSQASYNSWVKSGGKSDKLHIIYPGSDIDEISSLIANDKKIHLLRQTFNPEGRPLIGIFGRICSWKGQDVFLKAISEIDHVQAVIVGGAYFGEDDYFSSLKAFVRDHNLSKRVHFAGHLDDVPAAMAACDIVVHASTDPEPFGLVITEAMICGKPVIASNAGGATEIIENKKSGLLTPPGDASALASAIQTYLTYPDMAEQIATTGQARAKELFSNAAMIEKFQALLAQFRSSQA